MQRVNIQYIQRYQYCTQMLVGKIENNTFIKIASFIPDASLSTIETLQFNSLYEISISADHSNTIT